jgi:hypothetical protein
MPDRAGGVAEDIAQDMNTILVTIGTGKLENGKIHYRKT